MFVLIVTWMMYTSGAQMAVAVSMQEFNSQTTCEAAKAAVMASAVEQYPYANTKAFCIEK